MVSKRLPECAYGLHVRTEGNHTRRHDSKQAVESNETKPSKSPRGKRQAKESTSLHACVNFNLKHPKHKTKRERLTHLQERGFARCTRATEGAIWGICIPMIRKKLLWRIVAPGCCLQRPGGVIAASSHAAPACFGASAPGSAVGSSRLPIAKICKNCGNYCNHCFHSKMFMKRSGPCAERIPLGHRSEARGGRT